VIILTACAEEIATCQSQNQARCTRPKCFHHQLTRRLMPYQSECQKAMIAAKRALGDRCQSSISWWLCCSTLLAVRVSPIARRAINSRSVLVGVKSNVTDVLLHWTAYAVNISPGRMKMKGNQSQRGLNKVLPSQCSFSHGWDTSTSWDCIKLW
jgi:hypothetical protein